MPTITSPGIGSGLDIQSLVTQLVTFEGQPAADRLSRREAGFQATLSGLGTFRSALDAFRSALTPLKDLSQFGSRTASSSDEDLFTVSADNTVSPGDYSIDVISLASTHKLTGAAVADANTFIGTGSLSITLGVASFDVDILDSEAATLVDIRSAINNASNNPGVVASIVNADDGARLVLSGTKTGKDNEISVTASGGDGGLTVFDYNDTTTNMSEAQAAADSEITIDSFTYTAATNTITDAIDGLTIELEGADAGNPGTLSVGIDLDEARTLVEDFVDAYNALLSTTSELTRYNSETRETGLLQGNSIVASLTDRLSREFNKTVYGDLTSVRELGISVTLEGGLDLDGDVLDGVLQNNFADIGELFAKDIDGAAVRFDALLEDYLKADGLLDVRTDGLNSSIDRINDQRESLDRRLVAIEKRYEVQFLALDSLISELNNTSGFLNSQLSNLLNPAVLLGKNG